MDSKADKPTEPSNEKWTAGVCIGEPGYNLAAKRLIWRWVHDTDTRIPPNVALALGALMALAETADDR